MDRTRSKHVACNTRPQLLERIVSIKISCFFVFISAVFATVAANENCLAQIVASDNFDAASNLVSYSAVDAEGNDPDQWEELGGSGQDNFGVRSVADFSSDPPSGNFLSDATIDRSNTNSGSGDTLGVVTFDYADGNFFSIVDTDNGLNPSGVVTATWVFDISGAPSLGRFDVDAGAIGEFFDDGQGVFERFTWSYSIDGGNNSELIEFRGDSSLGPVTYSLADGNEVTFDNAFSANGTALTNGDALTTFSRSNDRKWRSVDFDAQWLHQRQQRKYCVRQHSDFCNSRTQCIRNSLFG